MVTVRGRQGVERFMRQLPQQIEEKLLRGAARKGATVIADEAKARSISAAVSKAVQVSRAKVDNGRVIVRIQVKGPGDYLAPWLEYGTDPHFIRVADVDRQGMTIKRINRINRNARQAKEGSLVIGGNFIGPSVHHPGATPHPFLTVALDMKEAEAIAAAQEYINTRLARARGRGLASLEEDE